MLRFVQLHLLTSYPPSNLNRDDLGRPKTAVMGGKNRLRISSQSLKRAWRTSDIFEQTLKGYIGNRTKKRGQKIYEDLIKKNVKRENAINWARKVAEQFGKLKVSDKDIKKLIKEKIDDLETTRKQRDLTEQEEKKMEKWRECFDIEQLVHISPDEDRAIDSLVEKISKEKREPKKEELELLRKDNNAADIALFGRMLASKPDHNVEAAAQVAHAISVQSVAIEDDFFTAVDDLNSGENDLGAAHLGETEFASGLFYIYICIDKELLVENLSGDKELTKKTLAAFIESTATVSPTGKQNSFASRARASYIKCEIGNQQPRSLSVAFLDPVDSKNDDMLNFAIKKLENETDHMDRAYGKCADSRCTMNVPGGRGTLEEIIQCATEKAFTEKN